MKKSTNIENLKQLVNNNAIERVELHLNGVQAYNIAEGEEYAVIVAYAKQGGRYYFIDRDGRRFLASRYDRAEFVAGEMLEVIANDRAAAQNAADQVERAGSVLVCADLIALFFEECDRRNIKVTSTAAGVDDLARMLTRFDLVKTDEDNQAATDEGELDDSDAQDDDNNKGDQTPAEPSRLAPAAAKVAEKAKTLVTRSAFVLALAVVAILSFATFVGVAQAFLSCFRAVGIAENVCFVLVLCAFVPAMDVALWIECNALVVVARLFPRMFEGPRTEFLAPGSFFWHVYRSNI